jgi:hypothetical protein
MAKKRNKTNNESVEEKVLKKYRKYKIEEKTSDEQIVCDINEEVNHFNNNNEIDSNLEICENEKICAQNIFNKFNKFQKSNNKSALKLRKKLKKKSKTDFNIEIKETNINNKAINAIKYLKDWRFNRNEWKFKKTFQIWLIKNWANIKQINDQDFDLLIEYILTINKESLAKQRLETEAKNIIEKEEEQNNSRHFRARKLMQCFV